MPPSMPPRCAAGRLPGLVPGLLVLLLAGHGRVIAGPPAPVPVSGEFHEPLLIVPPVLDLGAPQEGTGLQAQTFSLRLPAGQPFRLALDAGQNPAAQQRRMVHDGDSTVFLPYELYQDAAGQQPWGDGSGSVAGEPLSGIGTGADQPVTVWSRWSPGPGAARPGDYHDALTVSVSY